MKILFGLFVAIYASVLPSVEFPDTTDLKSDTSGVQSGVSWYGCCKLLTVSNIRYFGQTFETKTPFL